MSSPYALKAISALRPQEHQLEPGSPAWHVHRAKYRNASDAPAMLGQDPHRSRNDLLHQLHVGFQPDTTDFKQGILESGHRIEALARPLGEAIVGEDLYQRIYTRGRLGASLDGCTLDRRCNWECKRLNADLREALPHAGPNTVDLNDAADLPVRYRIQMEQQLLVDGAMTCLFTAAEEKGGVITEARHCWYVSNPELRDGILAGWIRLDEDLENYTPPEVVDATPVVARRPDQLPAITSRVEGKLVLESNIKEWEEAALVFIKSVRDHELKTDEDFANADAAAKWCDTSKETLIGVRANLMGATGDVNVAIGTLDRIVSELDATRLAFEKAIRIRKETRKTEMADEARTTALLYLGKKNEKLAALVPSARGSLLPELTHEKIAANFGKCFLNKRSFKNMQDALDQEVARVKIAIDALTDLFEANLHVLATDAKDHRGLFADWRELLWKPTEDLQNTVRLRIADHLAEVKRKADADAEAERLRLAEEERQRQEQQQRAAAAPAPAPTTVPSPGPTAANDVTDVMPRYSSSPAVVGGLSAGTGAGEVYERAPSPRRSAPTTPPTLKVGDMNARLGLVVTSALIKKLGFQPSVEEGTKILWHEQDWPAICDGLIRHIVNVRNTTAAKEAA